MKRLFTILSFTALCLTTYSQTETPKIGYYSRASVGVLTGRRSTASLQVANGISLKHTDLGLALGLEVHDRTGYAPIMLESRYNFGDGATQPFIGINGGYLASLSGNNYTPYRGGYTMGVSVGITHYFTRHFGITTAIGYRYSFTNADVPYWVNIEDEWPTYGQNVILDQHRFEFRVGIHFR
jgi:hypothetical protein